MVEDLPLRHVAQGRFEPDVQPAFRRLGRRRGEPLDAVAGDTPPTPDNHRRATPMTGPSTRDSIKGSGGGANSPESTQGWIHGENADSFAS
jgi:hypothetical protein